MTTHFQNSRGFSLVEVVVVAGLLGGLALFVMKIMDYQQSTTMTSEAQMDSLSLRRDLDTLLRNPTACLNTLGIGSDLTEDIDSLIIRDQNNNVLYQEGSSYGRIEIEDIKFNAIDSFTDAGNYLGNIDIQTSRANQSGTRGLRLSVFATLNSDGELEICSSGEVEQVAAVCIALDNYSWDEEQNRCVRDFEIFGNSGPEPGSSSAASFSVAPGPSGIVLQSKSLNSQETNSCYFIHAQVRFRLDSGSPYGNHQYQLLLESSDQGLLERAHEIYDPNFYYASASPTAPNSMRSLYYTPSLITTYCTDVDSVINLRMVVNSASVFVSTDQEYSRLKIIKLNSEVVD